MNCIKKLGLFVTFLLMVASGINYGMEDQRGVTLFDAAHNNDCLMITQLLNDGVDINTVDFNGNTALMEAAFAGSVDAVECLIDSPHQIKINQQNNDGTTALMYAVDANNCPIITLLLDKGAEINLTNFDTETSALLLAAKRGRADAVQCLLNDPNVAINQQDYLGNTALAWAIHYRNKVIVKQLLDAGADPELANKGGIAPRNVMNVTHVEGYYPQGYQQGDAEILSLIHKAIMRKHGVVNPFIERQQ